MVTGPSYVPTSSAQDFPFLHVLADTISCHFNNSHSKRGEIKYLSMVLIFSFSMMSDIEHLSMYLLTMCMFLPP